VHILAYLVDPESPELRDGLEQFRRVRRQRIHDMVARLNGAGVALTVDAVMRLAKCDSPGRPHVARALVAGGFVTDYDLAFEYYLKKGRAAWVPKARMEAAEAIRLVHGAGGLAVLAHPALYRDDSLVGKVAAAGADGLECWHSRHSAAQSQEYRRQAAALGLVATGGSDCHGFGKGPPLVGTLEISYDQVERLRERRSGVRGANN
jgi:predicted metal-dependent phosphoesterase TrpH